MPDSSEGKANRAGLRDLAEMWTAMLDSDWNSLAVIPTDHGVCMDHIVESLRESIANCTPPVRLIDARGVDTVEGKRLAAEVAAAGRENSRSVLVVDSLMRSLSGLHLLQAADFVLLVIRLGKMDLDSLATTITAVGADRIVGSVTATSAE